MWIWPSNPIDLVFRKLSISQFPPTAVSQSLSLPVLLFTTAASCGGQVAALSCCEETTTGKSMKSWAPINLNVGLVVGVLFVLLTYLVLSQQAATSGLSGTESFHTLAISNQRADHETRTAVKFLLFFLDMQLPPRSRNGSWTNISRRLTVRLKPVSTSDPPPIPIPCA